MARCDLERVGSRSHLMRTIEEERAGADARDCHGSTQRRGSCPALRGSARRPRRNCAPGRRRERHRNECCADDDWDRAHRSDHASGPLHGRSIGAQLGLSTRGRHGLPCWRPALAVVRSWLCSDKGHFPDSRAARGARRRSTRGSAECRERALLGALLLHVGEVVSVDTLIDSVWGERAPASARHMVHEYVSRLRGALGDASVIATRAPGYVVERDACDSTPHVSPSFSARRAPRSPQTSLTRR